jgi:hypothetical protein
MSTDDRDDDITTSTTPTRDSASLITFRSTHARPSRPLLPAPPVLLMLDLLLLAAAPPRPISITPGLPSHFYWQVEEGGSSAKRWTPLPRKSRRDAAFRPRAGRRPVDV